MGSLQAGCTAFINLIYTIIKLFFTSLSHYDIIYIVLSKEGVRMNPKQSMAFKKSILKSTWWGYGLINLILNAVIYYFSNQSSGTMPLANFMTNIAITGVILSLICSGFVLLTVAGMRKNGQIPEHNYDRTDHLLIHFFPKNAVLQLIVITILITVQFLLIGGGICVLCGFTQQVPVLPGAIINGILCGLMGMSNVYLMYVARLTSIKAMQA